MRNQPTQRAAELRDGVERAMLAEARSEVAAADLKASMVLAALGIGFGAVLGGLIAGDWEPAKLGSNGEYVWWIGAALAASSIGASAVAVWPRYTKTDVSGGIFYWGHVARFDNLEDLARALNSGSPKVRDRTRHQLWRLSRIVNQKYTCVRLAFLLAGVGVLAFVLASLLSYFRG